MIAALVLLAALPAASPVPTAASTPRPWILAPVQPGDALPDAKGVDGRRLLLDCEKSFLKLKTMRGTIRERSILVPGDEKPTESESDFWYRRTDDVRFENTLPIPHTVVWNGKKLVVWSPRENAVLDVKADELDIAAKNAFNVLPGYGFDLLGPIVLDGYVASAKQLPKDRVAVLLTPKDGSDEHVSMQAVVDPKRKVLERLTLIARGTDVIADTEVLEFAEAKSGVFFGTEVHSKILLPDGGGLEKLRFYERMKYDIEIEDGKFEFPVPDGAKRVGLPQAMGGVAKPVPPSK